MKQTALVVLAWAAAAPALAQSPSYDELARMLHQRDLAIAALEKRLDALEQERDAHRAAAQVPAPAAVPAVVATPAPAEDSTELEALSRTLVQRGGLLLPAWSKELVPSLAYDNSLQQGLALVDTPEGISTVADQRLRSDGARATVALRMGLPWSSQIELRAPYVWTRQSRVFGDGRRAVNDGSGIGDVELALSHQLLRGRGWRPDLVGAVSWRFPTGRSPFTSRVPAVATGAGTHHVEARLTAVHSSDPMVFFSTLTYGYSLSSREAFGRIRPGASIELELGGLLAVSPSTSLNLALAQNFRAKTEIEGSSIAGTDGVASVLQFGIDQVVAHNVLLDVSLGVGLTKDAPDYTFAVSTPIRF